MSDTIYFYSIHGDHEYMSNFAHYAITIDGIEYKTTEHYFQSKKFEGTSYETKVRKASGAMEAARLGRDRSFPLRKDWEQVKDDVMRVAVEAKFRQHRGLAKKLLETGTATLVEHTVKDSYWANGGNGKGKNMLGKILMEVRSKLRSENEKS